MSESPTKLGALLDPDGAHIRDAVHVAVYPAVADEPLHPGEHVGLNEGGLATARVKKTIGIVDPFLKNVVDSGEHFWLCLYPGSITSLRHLWSHPEFEVVEIESRSIGRVPKESLKVAVAKKIIEEIAAEMGGDGDLPEDVEKWGGAYGPYEAMTYDRLMKAAEAYLKWDEYEVERGSERWRDMFPSARFWPAYEIVTGTKVPEEKKGIFFSCSC